MKVRIEVPVEEWLKKERSNDIVFIALDKRLDELFIVYESEDIFIDCDNGKIRNITHVLEEVELSELIKEIMPSEEEVRTMLSDYESNERDQIKDFYNSGLMKYQANKYGFKTWAEYFNANLDTPPHIIIRDCKQCNAEFLKMLKDFLDLHFK